MASQNSDGHLAEQGFSSKLTRLGNPLHLTLSSEEHGKYWLYPRKWLFWTMLIVSTLNISYNLFSHLGRFSWFWILFPLPVFQQKEWAKVIGHDTQEHKWEKSTIWWKSLMEHQRTGTQGWGCLTLCDPTDCSLPGSSVHGVLQARILECVVIPFSRGSSQLRDRTWVFHIAGRFFTGWATRGGGTSLRNSWAKWEGPWEWCPL